MTAPMVVELVVWGVLFGAVLGLGLLVHRVVFGPAEPVFVFPEIEPGTPLWVARDLADQIEAGAPAAAHEEQAVRVVMVREGPTCHVVVNGVCMTETTSPWAAASVVARVVETARTEGV